jgi:hypothetical protein
MRFLINKESGINSFVVKDRIPIITEFHRKNDEIEIEDGVR